MQVSVFCDVTDPWSYIGVTRLYRAAATFTLLSGEPVVVELRAKLLHPDWPDDARPLASVLAEEFGSDASAEAHIEQVCAAGQLSGIDFNFDDAVRANSFDAWRLLSWAGDIDPGAQHDLAQQLWRAHFLEGADLGDSMVLASRGALAGLDLAAADHLLDSAQYGDVVDKQNETAQALGVDHLPVVIAESRWTLAGVQSQDGYLQGLQQMYQQWRDEI